MKKLYILPILFFFIVGNAQTINIKWKGSKVMDYGTETLTVPFFENEGFVYENQSVYFTLKQKSTGQRLKVQNLNWEKISRKDIYQIEPMLIPRQDIISATQYYNKFDNETLDLVAVSTLKYDKNQIFRLVSFDLVPDNNSKIIPQALNIGTTDNPLKSGSFYKIKVDKSGVFKITTEFLQQNGINPSNFNPKNFRIYGNGGLSLPEYNADPRFSALQENAIQVVGEEDGVWNAGDYALFYAQGPHGYKVYSRPNGNRRSETRGVNSPDNFVNVYDDYAYYFINFDIGEGKRIQDMDTPLSGTLITRYDAYQFVNEEKFNLMKFGRIWTGDAFSDEQTITFNTNSPIQTGDVVSYKLQVIGKDSQGNGVEFSINNANSNNIPIGEIEYIPVFYSGNINSLSGNQINLKITPNISTNPNGKFYLDYAEVQYKENLQFNGEQMNFRDFSINEKNSQTFSFSVSNASEIEQIWDVSDITNVSRKVNKSGNNSTFNFSYIASSLYFNNEFVAFKQSAAFAPTFVGQVANQDLSALQNVEYLMITTPEFMSHAQRLANYYQGTYNVAVVDVNKIYNEFSSGSKDITAIRDFATKLNNPIGTLKYIFILGDTSYDPRGRMVPGSDFVPAYQSFESGSLNGSFVMDDYYGMTQPQGTGYLPNVTLWNFLPDIPVGRLPAANVSEAKLLIDKTLAYYNALPGQSTPFGEWRMKLDFIVDDDLGTLVSNGLKVPFHTTVDNSLVLDFELPVIGKPEYNLRKLYLDSFVPQVSSGGQRFLQINQAISNDVSNSLFMFYFGHGGINGWAQERVLGTEDIQNFNNYTNIYSRFPLTSTITCEFTLWDDPGTFSAGEQFIKFNGGAATMITSSRQIPVNYGEEITTIFLKRIFALTNDDFDNLGDAFLKTKIEKGTATVGNSHFRVNFLGDPAGKLSRPKRLLNIDNIESPVPGQIRALDFVTITGHINKTDGTLDSTFNGRVAINIYDKRLSKQTLNNDGVLLPVLQYTEEGSPIVKASGQVANGNFTVEFYVPKDINYTVGNGRILAYADNKSYDVFSNQVQQIGGINPDGINDNTPPIAHLYMNNTNFANGGITDQNPTFLACMTDDKGINSTGSGIGHDITVYLDGQIINTLVLNDFYSSGEGLGCVNPSLADYQKGYTTYPFRNLTPGEHQLTFKVWDINNNSTTETLNFIVKDESEQNLVINRPLNWPNPFTDKTYIQFEHNCDDILDVNVQIFTITGKLVRTISTPVSAEPFLEGFRTPRTAIEWDGKDDFGDTVGKGTYIFKIYARSQNQDKCRGGATAVEKMVMLK
ncbi:MAG: type IX secretion system sortase PorU [Flavobacteriaceae bacterium]|jgi:hypothetical protein|nr:type IX secretion system sortase PorU [Flavobacteriaceae bacterium]